jgi:hypothetical protein
MRTNPRYRDFVYLTAHAAAQDYYMALANWRDSVARGYRSQIPDDWRSVRRAACGLSCVFLRARGTGVLKAALKGARDGIAETRRRYPNVHFQAAGVRPGFELIAA